MGKQDKVNEFNSPLNVHESRCSSLALLVTLMTSCSSPWRVLQIPESRSVYVVSVPVPAQIQTKGRQSGEEELGWRTQASHGCQAMVKMQAQDVSFWATYLVTPGAFPPLDYWSLIALETAGFSSCVFVLGNKQETWRGGKKTFVREFFGLKNILCIK